MAVVTKYGFGARDPSNLTAQDSIYSGGRPHDMTSKVSIASGDSIASVLNFGKIPADAIIKFDGRSNLDCTAVTGAAMDLGFANAPAALLAAASIAAAAVVPITTVVTSANRSKRAWEHAGYTESPGGELMVIGKLTAAATAAGSVILNLAYVTQA